MQEIISSIGFISGQPFQLIFKLLLALHIQEGLDVFKAFKR